ncbi:MAG: GHKL domain-containing protein [Ruminococcus sp.]|uniref:sensor histidine kinase n=1 Tax=Ruminococcus sp. TaxID=41978 RepID=UPI0025CE081C|nr:sensor histidine kinase [Ruminococcus sp.]MBR5683902.1 GHKL domain-containing protein [Ruminococcus sp.]
MKIADIIIESVNSLCEAGIIVFYLYKIMKHKFRYQPVFLALAVAAMFGIINSITLLGTNEWVSIGITLVAMIIMSLILFESRLRDVIFYSLLFCIGIIAAEVLAAGALMLLNFGNVSILGMGRIIGMAASKLFCFWIAMYISEYLKPKQREIPFKNWLLIIFVPLLSIITLNGIYVSKELDPRKTVIYLVSVAGILLLNIFVFDFFDTYANTIKLQLMEQRLKSEEENYKLIEEKYTEIRQLKHDFSNQLAAAKRMFSQGESPEALDHLDKLYSSVMSAGGVCYTGISSIDAIVNMKWDRSLQLELPFTCKVVFPDKMDIDELLLCRIIANLLDNAIEGAENSSAEDKFVYIALIQNSNKLRICVMNSSDEVDADHLRTKKSGFGHGIGVNSVKEAVKQLDGIFSFKWANGIFTADIMIAYK